MLIFTISLNQFTKTQLAEERKVTKLKIETLEKELLDQNLNHQQSLTTARAEAIVKSKAVTRGNIAETFIPFAIGNLNPRDFRHLGDPIDYIVFSGVHNSRDTEPTVNEILFIEVKTSKSRLSKVQKAIKEAVKENRVKFLTLNPDKEPKESDEQIS
jgi:predicted Holliday junction resolvase-like endonuclease